MTPQTLLERFTPATGWHRFRRFAAALGGSLLGIGLSGLSAITIPIQVIRLADDDGSNMPPLSAADAKSWIDGMNTTYAANSTSINFTFDPLASFTTVRSTLLNAYDGSPVSSKILLNEVCRQFPGKMCMVARGNTGGGFSAATCDFVNVPGYWATANGFWGQNYGLISHEFGHHLGLGHCFGWYYDTKAEAEADLANYGNDISIWSCGVPDISPFPLIGAYNPTGPAGEYLNGVWVDYHRSNVMGYYEWPTPTGGTFTANQKTQMTVLATNYQNNPDMAWHQPYNIPFGGTTTEFDYLPITASSSGVWTEGRGMAEYEVDDGWIWNDHLIIAMPGSTSYCTFQFNVPTAGTYKIVVYGTKAPDHGKIQFQIDGVNKGSVLDAYSPITLPTGGYVVTTISLSAGNHTIKAQVTGKNAASGWYHFGVDALQLVNTTAVTTPVIHRQPLSQYLDSGKTVTFRVAATGNSLAYQWRKNGTNISGATASSYSIANLTTTNNGSYSCRVTNSAGNVTSSSANLVVQNLPNAPYIMEGEGFLNEHRQIAYNVNNIYPQDMSGFGSGWSGGAHLRVDGQSNASIQCGMPVDKPGTYYFDVYLTKASDAGRYQLNLDGTNIGSVIDLYSPTVTTTGRLRFGPYSMPLGIHWFTLTTVGKNASSSGYQLGIDKVELQP